jgi:23S rRNA pseudouridine1911/1915/1917 synthase
VEYSLVISSAFEGRLVKSILQNQLGMSRKLLRQLIQNESVIVNGRPVYLTSRVALGDVLSILLPKETSMVVPTEMPLDISYEDDEVLVVNKPPQTLTHPTAREKTDSLLSGVAHYLLPTHQIPHSVHRLDRDTSGVVMFAKHAHAHHLMDVALREGTMHRDYVALVYRASRQSISESGPWETLRYAIAQDEQKPSRRVVVADDHPDGQVAITHYRLMAQVEKVAMVQLRLETGRTHQIRLHMATAGMPLLGDADYTAAYAASPLPEDANSYRRLTPRQALHAFHLQWTHPLTKQKREAAAPIAEDLRELWAELGGKNEAWDALQTSETV